MIDHRDTTMHGKALRIALGAGGGFFVAYVVVNRILQAEFERRIAPSENLHVDRLDEIVRMMTPYLVFLGALVVAMLVGALAALVLRRRPLALGLAIGSAYALLSLAESTVAREVLAYFVMAPFVILSGLFHLAGARVARNYALGGLAFAVATWTVLHVFDELDGRRLQQRSTAPGEHHTFLLDEDRHDASPGLQPRVLPPSGSHLAVKRGARVRAGGWHPEGAG